MTAPRFTLHLAKSDFKFAAAHFTWFADGSAEHLHGHSYRVSVRVTGVRVGADGILVEARVVKDEVRRLCAALDERVLLPRAGDRVEIEECGDDTNVRVAGRSYRLPAGDTVRLPVSNITVEALAAHFWRALAPKLASLGIDTLCVEIAESDGQSASYEAAL
ncbi:MAG: 6-carboxytetrahydropterin synthase [Deltaproteobacteria bacterium]|nr:6-carboxytetrahydropterin synthase [Deltaproteobacteria bacterium]